MVLYQLRTSHSAKWLGSCVQYDRNLYVLLQYLFAWNKWRSERRIKRCQDIGMESPSSVIRTTNGTTTYRWLWTGTASRDQVNLPWRRGVVQKDYEWFQCQRLANWSWGYQMPDNWNRRNCFIAYRSETPSRPFGVSPTRTARIWKQQTQIQYMNATNSIAQDTATLNTPLTSGFFNRYRIRNNIIHEVCNWTKLGAT
jgi:hypothetical protein